MEVTAEAVPRVRAARPAVWLTLGFMLLQAAWILTIPPFRGSDEFDHAYRAAGVAGGQWVATEPAENGRGLLIEVPPALVEAAGPQCSVLGYTGPDNCSPVRETDSGRVLVASGAATYFPLYYWVVGNVGEWADGPTSLYLMRMATALICAAFFFAAAWSLARGPTLWRLAALVLAATPVLVYSTSIVAPNGLEMTAALALWSSLLALSDGNAQEDERMLVLIAIVAAVAMCLLRLLGPFFVLAIFATMVTFRRRELLALVTRRIRLAGGGALVLLAACGTFVWWLRGPANVSVPDGPDVGTVGLTDGVVWSLQSIAAFPYRNQTGPLIVYGLVGALALALLFAGLRFAPSRERIVIAASFLAALVLPFAATWATADGRGVIWQGRYGLPYSVGFVLMAGAVVAWRGSFRSPRHPWPVVIALALYGSTLAACLLKVRGQELRDNTASMADTAWHVPPPLLLAGMVALAMGALAAGMIGPRDTRV